MYGLELCFWISAFGSRVSRFGLIARREDGSVYVFLQSLRVWVKIMFLDIGLRVSGFEFRIDRQAQSRERVRVLAVPACMGWSNVFGYRVSGHGFRVSG